VFLFPLFGNLKSAEKKNICINLNKISQTFILLFLHSKLKHIISLYMVWMLDVVKRLCIKHIPNIKAFSFIKHFETEKKTYNKKII
jgi:hypothetical protein